MPDEGASPLDAAPPRRRRSIEQTRRSLLEAGTRLVVKSMTPDDIDDVSPLAHIRVSDVVRHASESEGFKVTTGALYNIWDSQREYQRDLMMHILMEGLNPAAAPILQLASRLFAQRLPVAEAFARLADESFRLDSESQVGLAAGAFIGFAAVPEVHDALRTVHEGRLAAGRALYPLLLEYAGLRMREPYTIEQLITVIGALSDSLQQTRRSVPELFEVPAGERSLFAVSSSAVLQSFCEPIPADERS